MTESDSQSPPPGREGFERRWIKNDKYNGPERRHGGDRRRHPPLKRPMRTGTDPDRETETADKEPPTAPIPPEKFKPYRP